MNDEKPKLPKENAVKEMRSRLQKLKEERRKHYGEFAEALKKRYPAKKIAKNTDLPDADL